MKRQRVDSPPPIARSARLDGMPLRLGALAPDVAEKMRRAEALVTALPAMPDRGALNKAKEAADAARESTFPKLESGPDADYAAAYAASSLLLAAALLIEAEAFEVPADAVATALAAQGQPRACHDFGCDLWMRARGAASRASRPADRACS